QILHCRQLGSQPVALLAQNLGFSVDFDAPKHAEITLYRCKDEIETQSEGDGEIDQPANIARSLNPDHLQTLPHSPLLTGGMAESLHETNQKGIPYLQGFPSF